MNTWLRRMRLLSVIQTVLTVLRVLVTVRFGMTVFHAGRTFWTNARKGI